MFDAEQVFREEARRALGVPPATAEEMATVFERFLKTAPAVEGEKLSAWLVGFTETLMTKEKNHDDRQRS